MRVTGSVHRSDGGELSHRLDDDARLHVLPEERKHERDYSELDDESEDDPEREDPEREAALDLLGLVSCTTSSVVIPSSVSAASSVLEICEKLKSCSVIY